MTMNSATTPSASTSTTATSSTPEKRRVRRRQQALTAVRLDKRETIHTLAGNLYPAAVGDWVISLGAQILDVVPASQLDKTYETVVEGTVLPAPVVTQIEAITGIGTGKSAETLLAAIARLAKLEIGGVKIEFTPGQLAELKHRASKRGQTLEQTVLAVIDRIKDELFFHN